MTHEQWVRVGIAVGGVILAGFVAKLVDRRLAKRELGAGTMTRYRILRQTVLWSIVFVGVLSALLVIPQVRALAAGVLASSAVIGLVIGFAAQRTLGNFIAGLLIAFTQPVRLGDEIEIESTSGVVEEIGLTYTWVRTDDGDRLAIPNEKLASETIRNSTIRNTKRFAEVTVRLPLTADLRAAVSALEPEMEAVLVAELGDQATLAVRRYAKQGVSGARARSDLRLEVADRLRAAGIIPSRA
jgi:small conductance mechanosensitive channel